MAPTICSGKKRQTRTIATANIRRDGNSQLNHHAFSNIVNLVARGSLHPKVPAGLRLQNHNRAERISKSADNFRSINNGDGVTNRSLTHLSVPSASNPCHDHNYRQQLSFRSSTHSDADNSLDLSLAKEILNADSTEACGNNSTDNSNDSSPLPSSLGSRTEEELLSPALNCKEKPYRSYSREMETNNFTGCDTDGSDSEELDVHENDDKTISDLRRSNRANYYWSRNDFNSYEDELESTGTRELTSDMSSVCTDTDMETDESDSMTSLDTQKSAELKKSNNQQLRENLVITEINGKKPFNNTRSADGLLSIAIKTIKLVKRNQLLQERLSQLQLETSEFIQSVLANPENRHFRDNIKQNV